MDHETNPQNHVDDLEKSQIWDPSVGEGTPDTAPSHMLFEQDDELDAEGENGAALDGDDETDDDVGEIGNEEEPEDIDV